MLKDFLPPEILSKKKTGFRLPLNRWFRSDLKAFVTDQLLEGHPVFWQIFEKSKIDHFLKAYFASSIDYSDHVWCLLWLNEWCKRYTGAPS